MWSNFEFMSRCVSTESNRGEDKTTKLITKTILCFASEALKSENKTYNAKEDFKWLKKVSPIISLTMKKF